MEGNCSIVFLEQEPNKLGDLFGRLMGDLFLSLGYADIRLNISKSGREIDIEANHRTEKRRVIAECKATKDRVGGDEVNKFVGKLDVERRKSEGIDITGYFVSLNGFTETAIEQEKDAGGGRAVLINGKKAVDELIKGHILVSREKAMEKCGRCASGESSELRPEKDCGLIAHDIGWIWVIYYERNKERTHFGLVHADGEIIATSMAEKIIKSDTSIGGILKGLDYLKPKIDETSDNEEILNAKTKYFKFLESECGEITLEGLPADQDVGSRSLKLENIFVPLHLIEMEELENESNGEEGAKSKKRRKKEKRISVGAVLSKETRTAILAAPGGGKTTLIKRIALAYAFPKRKSSVADNLPDREWFPLFIRCRQLGDVARASIREVLSVMAKRAEMGDREVAFMKLINGYLRSGEALLLIDGLDEISDEQNRLLFVRQLRTFLATYPQVKVIITSRIAGFRIVGGQLYAQCKHFRLADFDNDDIKELVVAWHKEVLSDKEQVIIEAKKLADTICESERVRQLAINPLLLTTLLLVKRWIGQLPTRRSVLYGKAIEVLLMTWNVQGYEPIDQDEAIPQLAFVAYTMMKGKEQRVSGRRLREILTLARKQMPEILGYTKLSVSEFIQRVELRSSMMIMSGHDIENGTLWPMYEFRHLTFQEYLAARAIVEGYYPDRKEEDTILSIIKPHLKDESWYEVMPLVAVLSGRLVQPLVRYIIGLSKEAVAADLEAGEVQMPVRVLAQSIVDEIQIQPDVVEEALDCIANKLDDVGLFSGQLYKGRHGEIWFSALKEAFIKTDDRLLHKGHEISVIALSRVRHQRGKKNTEENIDGANEYLNGDKAIEKAIGALMSMELAFYCGVGWSISGSEEKYSDEERERIGRLGDRVKELISHELVAVRFAGCWAFAWLAENNLWSLTRSPDIMSQLLDVWMSCDENSDLSHVSSWAIGQLNIINRDLVEIRGDEKEIQDFIKKEASGEHVSELNGLAPFLIGFYMGNPWTDEELGNKVVSLYKGKSSSHNMYSKCESFLHALGDAGKSPLKELKGKRKERKRKNVRE